MPKSSESSKPLTTVCGVCVTAVTVVVAVAGVCYQHQRLLKVETEAARRPADV